MIELLYTAPDGTFPNGHLHAIGLGELRIVQAIDDLVVTRSCRDVTVSLPCDEKAAVS